MSPVSWSQRVAVTAGGPLGVPTNQPQDVAIAPPLQLAADAIVLVEFWAYLTVGTGATAITITGAIHHADGSGGGTVSALQVPVLAGEVGAGKLLTYAFQDTPASHNVPANTPWQDGQYRFALTQVGATANGTCQLASIKVTELQA